MGEEGAGALLEREESARRLADLAAAAVECRGSLVVVVGRAGEGKSALLGAAAGIGAQAGLRVWRARGTDLERPFALGVVRQLLVPAVVEIGPGERASVFEGAARVGLSALDLDEDSPPGAARSVRCPARALLAVGCALPQAGGDADRRRRALGRRLFPGLARVAAGADRGAVRARGRRDAAIFPRRLGRRSRRADL